MRSARVDGSVQMACDGYKAAIRAAMANGDQFSSDIGAARAILLDTIDALVQESIAVSERARSTLQREADAARDERDRALLSRDSAREACARAEGQSASWTIWGVGVMSRLNLQLPAKTVDGMQGAIGAELESLRRGHDEARAERARMIDSERDRRLRLSELEGGRTMLRQFLWTLAQPQIAAIMPLLSHEQGAALMEIVADVTTIPILEAYRDSAGRCPESAPLSARPCTRAAGHAGPHACPPQGSAGRPGTFTDHTASEFCAAADVEVRVRCEGQDGHGCPDDATLKLRVPLTQCEDGTLALEASEVANCCVSGVWPMHSAGKRRVCPRCAR